MIHEQETREIVMLVFRAAKFGEAELLKAIQAYMRYMQNAPPTHGKVRLISLHHAHLQTLYMRILRRKNLRNTKMSADTTYNNTYRRKTL